MNATLDPIAEARLATDDALMERIHAGDYEDSLAELRRRFARRIYNLAHSILHDSHLAEDVCEEVFEKVYLKGHLYQTGTNFPAWLLEVTRNQALSTLRARRLLPKPASSLGNDDGNSDDLLENARGTYEERLAEEHELMAVFEKAVQELPERYRKAFQLCVREGKQYREAAEQLSIPTGTVAIRIMRARKRLFRTLSQHLGHIRRPPACFN